MSITAIANFFDDTEQQAKEWLGPQRWALFSEYVGKHKHRLGQAFFNSLDDHDQSMLRGSLADPYYALNWDAIQRAIDYLLEH